MLRQASLTIILTIAALYAHPLHGQSQSASGVWSSKFPIPPGANGAVYAMTTYRSNLIVAGEFSRIGEVKARGLAKWDGQTWSEFGGIESTNSATINAVASDGTNLYVGGIFSRINGVAAANVAKFNGDHWEPLGSGITGGGIWTLNPWVAALHLDGTNLYVGGSFIYAGSTQAFNIACWDGSQWRSLDQGAYLPGDSSDPSVLPYGRVNAIAGDGTNIFVGGWFTRAGGINTTNLAMWNGGSWQSIGSTSEGAAAALWEGEVISGFINALQWHDNALYVAGDFTRVAGLTITNFARWKNGAWDTPLAVNGPTIRAFKANDDLYLAGHFDRAATNGASFAATNILKLHNGAWTPIHAATVPLEGIYTLQNFGNALYAGGYFWQIDGISAAEIATLTSIGWQPLTPGVGNSLHGYVESNATDGTNIFAVGNFSIAGSAEISDFAKWNGSTWTALPRPATTGWISELALVGSKLYAAGYFENSELGATNLAAWDGQRWNGVGQPSQRASGQLLAVAGNLFATIATPDPVFLGNFFYSTGWWDGAQWQWVPWTTAVFSYYQEALATDGTNVFIARYAGAGPNAVTRVARWDGATVFEYPSVNLTTVFAFGAGGTNLWISGWNAEAGRYFLFAWNGSAWTEVPDSAAYISAIAAFGDNMIVAGNFTTIGGIKANGIALWDTGTWRALDRGILWREQPGTVRDINVIGKSIFVSGQFDRAGPNTSGSIAVWHTAADVNLTLSPTALNQLQITGGAGDHIQIEGTDSLDTWARLTDFVLPAATTTVTDARPVTTTINRFYRARILEP